MNRYIQGGKQAGKTEEEDGGNERESTHIQTGIRYIKAQMLKDTKPNTYMHKCIHG